MLYAYVRRKRPILRFATNTGQKKLVQLGSDNHTFARIKPASDIHFLVRAFLPATSNIFIKSLFSHSSGTSPRNTVLLSRGTII